MNQTLGRTDWLADKIVTRPTYVTTAVSWAEPLYTCLTDRVTDIHTPAVISLTVGVAHMWPGETDEYSDESVASVPLHHR